MGYGGITCVWRETWVAGGRCLAMVVLTMGRMTTGCQISCDFLHASLSVPYLGDSTSCAEHPEEWGRPFI